MDVTFSYATDSHSSTMGLIHAETESLVESGTENVVELLQCSRKSSSLHMEISEPSSTMMEDIL